MSERTVEQKLERARELLQEVLECQGRELGVCCQCREAIETAIKEGEI